MRLLGAVAVFLVLGIGSPARTAAQDFLSAKLAVDRQVDPTADERWERSEIDKIVQSATDLAGPNAPAPAKLDALRKVAYQPGPWNGNKPFDYDHDEAHFKDIRTGLLSTYLRTRLGNCVSMPVLFLILADRMGLNVELSRAPHHTLIRYTAPDGRAFILEPTSGAHAQRPAWIRYLMPMTDDALKNGVYLSELTHEQSVAEMRVVLLEWNMANHKYAEAISLADEILQSDPRNADALAWKGIAYGRMISDEFQQRYVSKAFYQYDPRYQELLQSNHDAFAKAEAMGWRSDTELPMNMDGWKRPVAEIRHLCPEC